MSTNQLTPRLLLIDDQEDIHDLVVDGLAPQFAVDCAADAYIAQQYVASQQYDLILCDIDMPFINGLVLLEEFQKKRVNIPFIFVSGHVNPEISRQAFALGAQNILEKPFRLNDLRDKIMKVLAMKDELAMARQDSEYQDQEVGYLYNMLKSYYYDYTKLVSNIKYYNIPLDFVAAEIKKKEASGQCVFDDPDYIGLLAKQFSQQKKPA